MGAMTGLTALAEEIEEGTEEIIPETTVAIKYKNVSYEGALKLVYYVESANLAEGDTVKLVVTDKAPEELVIDENTAIFAPAGKLTVGEGDEAAVYDAFITDEIAYQYLRQSASAIAVVLNADGEIVAQSAPLTYSVFDYCMDRFEADITDEQKNLYISLLDLGASIQKALCADDAAIAATGGPIDAYYGVKFNTVVGGEVVASAKQYYTAADVNKAQTAKVEKFFISGNKTILFNDVTFETPALKGALNGYDINYTVLADYGFTDISCSYEGEVKLAGFQVGKAPAFDGMTFPSARATAPGAGDKDDDGDGIPDGRYFVALSEKVTDAAGNETENVFIRYTDENDTGSSTFNWKTSAQAGKTTYIISFDFRWQYADNRRDGSSEVVYYNDIGSMTNNYLGSFTCAGYGSPLVMNGVSMKTGDWHNIEYRYVLDDATGKYYIYVYIDGTLALDVFATKEALCDEICFSWEPRYGNASGAGDICFDLDNLYFIAK